MPVAPCANGHFSWLNDTNSSFAGQFLDEKSFFTFASFTPILGGHGLDGLHNMAYLGRVRARLTPDEPATNWHEHWHASH
jgi:hypothetical protein